MADGVYQAMLQRLEAVDDPEMGPLRAAALRVAAECDSATGPALAQLTRELRQLLRDMAAAPAEDGGDLDGLCAPVGDATPS